jgi:hypothetical protein
MKLLVIECWLSLLYFDGVMHFRDFEGLHMIVRERKVSSNVNTEHTCEQLCHAIDLACVFYFKRVLCLQRSAATTVLLRRRGLKAEMAIGAQLMPFMSHAWVEIEGQVVNDKPYMSEIFQVLERC